MLRIEFEQTVAANEQTGPINKEMRNLITSLQSHNHQLKGEVGRQVSYKTLPALIFIQNCFVYVINSTQSQLLGTKESLRTQILKYQSVVENLMRSELPRLKHYN